MAEERDPLVSRRYRELGSEEPPAALDERVLARSRRPRSFQWHGPVAAAAVIVFAVAVTVHVERGQPPVETPEVPQAKPYQDERTVEKPQKREFSAKAPAAPAAPPGSGAREEARARRDAVREAAPQAPPPAAPEAPAAGAAADSAAKPMASLESRLAKLAEQSPERWLEGIAELRAQGRHEEADESLRRFRERYPDYRISEELKAKVEKK